jgi:hypothetical protein
VPTAGGVFLRQAVVRADGPLTKGYLDVFSAKLGMALYRQHIGERLPTEGAVESIWFLNAGLSQHSLERMVSIMPGRDRLVQGKKTSQGQFDYRYNTDKKMIVAALSGFHTGLHVLTLATSQPRLFELPSGRPHTSYIQPGQLRLRMPKVTRSTLVGIPLIGQSTVLPHRFPARPR